jgi:hypothetical protein
MAGDQAAEMAMSAAGTHTTPPPEIVKTPAPKAVPVPVVPKGPSRIQQATKVAKRLSASWVFKYIMVFVVVVGLLALIRPNFVLQHPLPSPDNAEDKEKLSLQRICIVGVIVVVVAITAPLIYEHRNSISSGVTSTTKSIKSMFGK